MIPPLARSTWPLIQPPSRNSFVAVGPGATTLTVMLRPRSSRDSEPMEGIFRIKIEHYGTSEKRLKPTSTLRPRRNRRFRAGKELRRGTCIVDGPNSAARVERA
jgi:hypothetical protein